MEVLEQMKPDYDIPMNMTVNQICQFGTLLSRREAPCREKRPEGKEGESYGEAECS